MFLGNHVNDQLKSLKVSRSEKTNHVSNHPSNCDALSKFYQDNVNLTILQLSAYVLPDWVSCFALESRLRTLALNDAHEILNKTGPRTRFFKFLKNCTLTTISIGSNTSIEKYDEFISAVLSCPTITKVAIMIAKYKFNYEQFLRILQSIQNWRGIGLVLEGFTRFFGTHVGDDNNVGSFDMPDGADPRTQLVEVFANHPTLQVVEERADLEQQRSHGVAEGNDIVRNREVLFQLRTNKITGIKKYFTYLLHKQAYQDVIFITEA